MVVIIEPIADTYIRTDTPNSNYGAESPLWLNAWQTSVRRALMKFDLSQYNGRTVEKAVLRLTHYNTLDVTRVAAIHKLTQDWNELEANWNKASATEYWGGSYTAPGGYIRPNNPGGKYDESFVGYTPTTGWVAADIDVTTLVQAWLNGDPNCGILIKYLDETAAVSTYTAIVSREATYPQYRPSLTLTFPVVTYPLTISASEGGVTDPPTRVHEYAEGSTVTVTATPNPGYRFSHWELDGTTHTENPIIVLMDSPHSLMAYFVAIPIHTLSITSSPINVTVEVTPA